MLLRRLYVFFIVLLVVSAVFHLMKRLNTVPRQAGPIKALYKTPVLLGYGPIQGVVKGQGRFHRTQVQVGRRRGRSRKKSLDSDK
jgi:hypothetical protein